MNCPGHVQIFKNGLKSYRDLPLKIAEFGKVHRFEPSGALHGLMRVRAFTQDDAHVFVTEEQIAAECLAMNDLILSIYEDFGFSDVRIKFSDRPEKRIGADDVWDKAEAALMRALEASGRPWSLNKGEGAFYGPKLEYVLRDAIGRDWQCGTVQVDLNLPGRLGAFYIDEHSSKVTPVMLHRAMFGSLERFTGILIASMRICATRRSTIRFASTRLRRSRLYSWSVKRRRPSERFQSVGSAASSRPPCR